MHYACIYITEASSKVVIVLCGHYRGQCLYYWKVPFKRVLLTSDDFLVRNNMCKTVEQKLGVPAFGIKFNWAVLSFRVKT